MIQTPAWQSYALWLTDRGLAHPILGKAMPPAAADDAAVGEVSAAAAVQVGPPPVRLLAVSSTALPGPERELLLKMIAAMGLRGEQFAVLDAPDGVPQQQAELVLALGREAAVALGATDASRGAVARFAASCLLLTAHPAELLREPAAKRQAWADLQVGMRHLGLLLPNS